MKSEDQKATAPPLEPGVSLGGDVVEEAGVFATDTDLAAFIKLYQRFGVDVIVNKCDDGTGYMVVLSEGSHPDEEETISEKFDGYTGFLSTIKFNCLGVFVVQGFWE